MNKVLIIASLVFSFQSVHAAFFEPDPVENEVVASNEGQDGGPLAEQVPEKCIEEKMDGSFQEKIEEVSSGFREEGAKRSSNTARDAIIGGLFYGAAKILESYGSLPAGVVATQFEAFVVADLITGSFHWLEDTYFSEETPIIGQNIIGPNRIHHAKPRELLKNNTFKRIRESAVAASIVMASLSLVLESNQLFFPGSVAVWAALANEIHAWEHMSPSEKPLMARLFQGYFFQSSEEHRIHHTTTDRNYCVMSPWWNWILTKTHFWRGLEYIVEFATGVPPRIDEMKQNKIRKENLSKRAL